MSIQALFTLKGFNQIYESIVRRSLGSDECDPDLDFVVLPTAGLQDTKCRLESLK